MAAMRFLDNIQIGKKLALGFGLVTLVAVVLGLYGYREVNILDKGITNIAHNRVPDLVAFGVLNKERMVIRAQTLAVQLVQQQGSTAQYRDILTQRATSWSNVDKAWEQLMKIPRYNARGKELIAKLKGEYSAWRAIYVELDRVIEQLSAASVDERSGLQARYDETVRKMIPLSDAMGATFDAITENNVGNTEKLAEELVAEADSASRIIIFAIVIGLGVAVFLSVSIAGNVARPIRQAAALLTTISQGNLAVTVPALLTERKDENGELGRAMQGMLENLRGMIGTIGTTTEKMDGSSQELVMYTSELNSATGSVAEKANMVAAASEQASSAVNNISAAAEEMSSSVASVATAIEEMSASLNEVARSCQKESAVAASADQKARATRQTMDKLGVAAKSIGKVVEVISDIADQTNLLALNATIEAASAGEAGRGFAVVANEVKELARQTAQATQEISGQIEQMQGNTTAAIEAIESITQVITEINSISQTIVSAVEEQSATINEIAGSMGGASSAASDIARNVNETATGLNDVSANVQVINGSAKDLVEGYTMITENAAVINKLSAELKKAMERFRV